jgi:protein gp37
VNRTKIEWADVVWNPLPGMDSPVELIEDKIMEPLCWRASRRVFVNSMSDLFHERVPDEWLYYILAVVAASPHHTFMVLTKRSRLMLHRIRGSCATAWRECILRTQESLGIAAQVVDWPLPNLWLGVSVENQCAADERIPDLLATPAALRFVSCEPLLGPVDLYTWLPMLEIERESRGPNDSYVDWVIVGGESGPRARPAHPDWVRQIRDQCKAARVPFFFKQWGEWLPGDQFGADGDKPGDDAPET